MKVNLNVICRVELTEKGKEVLTKYHQEYYPPKYYNYYSLDYYTSELWNIMHIFGKSMFNGCEIPFVNNELEILE